MGSCGKGGFSGKITIQNYEKLPVPVHDLEMNFQQLGLWLVAVEIIYSYFGCGKFFFLFSFQLQPYIATKS